MDWSRSIELLVGNSMLFNYLDTVIHAAKGQSAKLLVPSVRGYVSLVSSHKQSPARNVQPWPVNSGLLIMIRIFH